MDYRDIALRIAINYPYSYDAIEALLNIADGNEHTVRAALDRFRDLETVRRMLLLGWTPQAEHEQYPLTPEQRADLAQRVGGEPVSEIIIEERRQQM